MGGSGASLMVVQESIAKGLTSIFESVSILSASIFRSRGSILISSGSILRSTLAVESLLLVEFDVRSISESVLTVVPSLPSLMS